MTTVIQKENESRADYLVRVAIEMLRENAHSMTSIIYDEAECDALCLAEELEECFDLNTERNDKN